MTSIIFCGKGGQGILYASISAKQPNVLIDKCNFIYVDSHKISMQNKIPKKFQNMILLGFLVKYLHFENFNWHELITHNKNYEAFILGTNS